MDLSNISLVQYAGAICFFLAIVHTFSVKFFQKQAHHFPKGSVGENFFHFLGEIEVVFGIWAALFLGVYSFFETPQAAVTYLESRSFTEPLLVFALMAVCSTKPILIFATQFISAASKLIPINANMAFYISTLILGPILGSFITEPAAMTVTALVLLNRFYNNGISQKLRYATIGLLFVNISIGGTLTSFAAPPVLMVAQKWNWDMIYMLTHFGWKACVSIVIATLIIATKFKNEISGLSLPKSESKDKRSIPIWITVLHILFLFFIVLNHHHSVVFIGVFLFFLGLAAVTQEYQSEVNLKSPLLVAFFLGGLIILGGMQGWWLSQILTQLGTFPLYIGAMTLTAVTDNAAITYLGSQVEGLSELSKYALVAGSVVGGGLTVIANAPNPAGYSILNSTFGRDGISALDLFKSALLPTLIAALCFWIL